MGTCRVYLDASDADVPPDGPQGKPPTGYKCKICESEEVRPSRICCGGVLRRPPAQHFITDCPEREKPKEGYACRVCNEVSLVV